MSLKTILCSPCDDGDLVRECELRKRGREMLVGIRLQCGRGLLGIDPWWSDWTGAAVLGDVQCRFGPLAVLVADDGHIWVVALGAVLEGGPEEGGLCGCWAEGLTASRSQDAACEHCARVCD